MRILTLPDIHGRIDMLTKIMKKIRLKNIDVIVSQGDFTDMYDIPEGFSQLDVAELIIQKLVATNKHIIAVPGNHDPYHIIQMFDEYGVNIHDDVKEINKIYFTGFGGAETPFNTKFEPDDNEIMESLNNNITRIKGDFVLVVHNPPYNTKLDVVDGKHVGSKAIRAFIEKNKPILVLTAHIHENKGVDKIGQTKIFYPGPVFNGNYGIVDIENKKITCKIYNINQKT